ncbi:MAG: hypothetical protein JW829_03950 [Pirellulales bacterium]|nr:hypothetical protein [Pirellulales bacterium]
MNSHPLNLGKTISIIPISWSARWFTASVFILFAWTSSGIGLAWDTPNTVVEKPSAAISGHPTSGPNNSAKQAVVEDKRASDSGTEVLGKTGEARSREVRQDDPGSVWIRIHRNSKGEPLALQTAIVRYQRQQAETQPQEGPSEKKITVDLIGAIHVGDRAYYNRLNRRFKQYEALLYELVAPEGMAVPKGRGTSNMHPIGAMQNGLKGVLDLEHQLERVDYTRKNFIHADMSPSELAKSMQQRNESFLQMYFRLVGAEMARQSQQQSQGKFAEFDFLTALFAPDRTRRLKIALAEQFTNMESLMAGLDGPDGSTLITERNKLALEVLSEQISKGRYHLGIFYGAGHLPDMHERLINEFHMTPVEVLWMDAWDLRSGG